MINRVYSYKGPADLLALLAQPVPRVHIQGPSDLIAWLHSARSTSETVTFIADTARQLWIADRHSEHVVCARGQSVLAAGELTFGFEHGRIAVTDVTNQSTGYCPEPEAWVALSLALDEAQINHPPTWTSVYLFRRCSHCCTTNIIKDAWYECAVCDAPLSPHWNYDQPCPNIKSG